MEIMNVLDVISTKMALKNENYEIYEANFIAVKYKKFVYFIKFIGLELYFICIYFIFSFLSLILCFLNIIVLTFVVIHNWRLKQ